MLKDTLTNILQNIANLPIDKLSNDTFLLRDIFLYGYLLQRRDGIIRKSELVKYISPSGEAVISAAMAAFFVPPKFATESGENYTFSDENLSDIQRAFNEQGYSLSQPVPYWGNVTGEQLVQYFCGMGDQPPRPLTDLAESAFRNALQVDEVARINDNILHVQINANVSFYVYIKQTDGALRFADANEIFAELGTHEVVGTGKHILVCAANSDDNRAADQMKRFPLVYHAWSISVIGLFNILKQLIDDKGKGEISKRILRMFPEARQAYFSEHLAKKQLS